MATKIMSIAIVFYVALMSEICLIMSNPIKLEVTISGACQVENGTEGIFGGIIAENHAYPWQVKLERLNFIPEFKAGLQIRPVFDNLRF